MRSKNRAGHLSERSEKILALLMASERPLGAYDLARVLGEGDKSLAPVKIYRALDALKQAGLVLRVESRNAFIALRRSHSPTDPVALLVCSCCGKVEEAATQATHLIDELAATGFQPTALVMEVIGNCAPCAGTSSPNRDITSRA